jgi:hypothetical protein
MYRLHTITFRNGLIIRAPNLDHQVERLTEQGIHQSQAKRGSRLRGTIGLWEPMDDFQSSPNPSTFISD